MPRYLELHKEGEKYLNHEINNLKSLGIKTSRFLDT